MCKMFLFLMEYAKCANPGKVERISKCEERVGFHCGALASVFCKKWMYLSILIVCVIIGDAVGVFEHLGEASIQQNLMTIMMTMATIPLKKGFVLFI